MIKSFRQYLLIPHYEIWRSNNISLFLLIALLFPLFDTNFINLSLLLIIFVTLKESMCFLVSYSINFSKHFD